MFKDYLKTIPHYLLPKGSMTALAGQLANVRQKQTKNYLIKRFIKTYDVDMSEAQIEDPEAYDSFNEFFIRKLKPNLRPIATTDIVSPADGKISEAGMIEKGRLLQAKNRYYSTRELLGDKAAMHQTFDEGCFMTVYLSPRDYHRVHMPIDGILKEMTYLPGKLFSVQDTTSRTIPRLFARNERLCVYFDTAVGPMAMVMVGATIVGAIGTSWHGEVKRTKRAVQFDYHSMSAHQSHFKKGEEMGYFKLGSTVIVIFADPSKINWIQKPEAQQPLRLGQALAMIKT